MTKSEFVVSIGTGLDKAVGSSKTMNVVFKTGEYKENDANFGTSGVVFYGLEKDRWHNVVIAFNFDGKNLIYKVYVDGTIKDEHYRYNTSKGMYKVQSESFSPTAYSNDVSPWYFLARATLKYVVGEKHDFYFDNVIYKAGAVYTGDTKATIESAVDGVVTVENDVTLEGIKALATGADAVEIYRANSQATTGYDAITENFATGDIVKLVTQKGSYSYYTLNVTSKSEEPEEPEFVIGDLSSYLDVSGGNVSASVALTGGKADKDVTLVVCLYKGITLIDMVTDSVATGEDPKTLST